MTDWLDATSQVVATATKRGFTGHEMLDDVGLVHMGGRVYDPTLGRFLSADPHVQSIQNPQALNRYSYVLNNPLSMTDPSGFFFKGLFKAVKKLFSKVFKNKIVRMAASIGVAFIPGINAFAAGFISGMISSGGDIRAGIIGALSAGSLDAIAGEAFADAFGELANVAQTVASGVVGGIGSELQGGSFVSGFAAAAFTRGFAPVASKIAQGNKAIGTVLSAVSGGVAAELGGGKFANGAITGAFTYVAFHVAKGVRRDAGREVQPSGSDRRNPNRQFAQAGIQATDATPPIVTLYRTVDMGELNSLMINDMRLLPSPNGAMVKYFWQDPVTATAFGNSLATNGKGWFVPPLHVISAQIPSNLLDNNMFISLADIPAMGRVTAIALPNNLLSYMGKAQIVGAIPLPQ